MERIEDIADARLDLYARLTDVQLRSHVESENGFFIAESAKVASRALDAGYEPISLVVPEHRLEREQALVDRFEGHEGVDVFAVPGEQLQALAGYEVTRGVLAAMRRKPLPSLDKLLEGASRVAVLEGVTNHANVGSVFRNAAALGVDAVLVSPDCSDPMYRRAIRVSMGTVFQVPWTRLGGGSAWLDDAIEGLRRARFETCAFALHDESMDLGDERLARIDKLAMFFGTEGAGLAQGTIDACDHVVKIPMREGVDSLNVAATSAVAFWELRKRTGRGGARV